MILSNPLVTPDPDEVLETLPVGELIEEDMENTDVSRKPIPEDPDDPQDSQSDQQ